MPKNPPLRRPRLRQILLLFCLAALGIAGSEPSTADTIRVGSGAACDESDPQVAIVNASAGDVIEIAAGDYTLAGQITLVNKPLTLLGGYNDACDGTLAGGFLPLARLQAGAGARHFSIVGGNTVMNLISLAGGQGPNFGGSIFLTGGGRLEIHKGELSGNQSGSGGAIYVANGSTVELLEVTQAQQNWSTDPGGGGGVVACEDSTLRVGLASFSNNTASGRGGAIDAVDCDVSVFLDHPTSFPLFITNHAENGGAIAACDGTFEIARDAGAPVGGTSFLGNSADSDGGAIYLRCATTLNTGRVSLLDGDAANGAAVALVGQSRWHSRDCSGGAACVQLDDNTATANGGAISVVDDASLDLRRFSAFRNAADAAGSFVYVRGNHTTFLLASGIVAATPPGRPGPVFAMDLNSAALDDWPQAIHGVTFIDHPNNTSVLHLENLRELSVERSVFSYNAGPVLTYVTGVDDPAFQCNIVDETASLPPSHQQSLVVDPLIDLAGIPSTDSPVIDLCAAPGGAFHDSVDLRREPRPFAAGVDAGGIEVTEIFSDGFESGDVTSWSASTQ